MFRRLITLAVTAALVRRARPLGARRAGEDPGRRQDDDDLRGRPAHARSGHERADGARRGEPRRRVLLPRDRDRDSVPSSIRSAATPAKASAAGATRSTASLRRSAPTRPRSRPATRCSGTGIRSPPQGGSPTLAHAGTAPSQPRATATRCFSQNDLGQTTPATGATLLVDGRRVAARSGRVVRRPAPRPRTRDRQRARSARTPSGEAWPPSRPCARPARSAAGTSARAPGAPRSGSPVIAGRRCSSSRQCRRG